MKSHTIVPDPGRHHQLTITEGPEKTTPDTTQVLSTIATGIGQYPKELLANVDPASEHVVITISLEVGQEAQQALETAGFKIEVA